MYTYSINYDYCFQRYCYTIVTNKGTYTSQPIFDTKIDAQNAAVSYINSLINKT